jgi:hypothetical protein
MILAIVSAPAVARSYDCQTKVPRALHENADSIELTQLQFPGLDDEAWSFSVEIKPGGPREADTARVSWSGDPIQIAGSFPMLRTAEDSIVFTAFSVGPCMFTELACMALVQIVDQPEGGAKLLILPSAMWSDKKNDKRDPFVAVIEGTCTRDES